MDWVKLMEKSFYGIFFMISILFLYVIFGIDIPIIVLLSLIYLRLELDDE